MNCIDCKDFTCPHRSENTGGGSCYYESGEQKEKLLTMAAEASLHYVDWSSFRREAAKDILAGMVANKVFRAHPDDDDEDYLKAQQRAAKRAAFTAIVYADELIKRLKDE